MIDMLLKITLRINLRNLYNMMIVRVYCRIIIILVVSRGNKYYVKHLMINGFWNQILMDQAKGRVI